MGRFHQLNEPLGWLASISNQSSSSKWLKPSEKYIFQLSPKDIPNQPSRSIYISDRHYDSAVLAPDQATGLFWRNNSRAKFVEKNKLILVTVPPENEDEEYDKEIWIDPEEWEVTNVWEDTQFNEPESWATQDLGKIFDDYELREPIQGEDGSTLGNSWLFNTLSPHRWPDIVLDHHEGKVLFGDKKVVARMREQLSGSYQTSINMRDIRRFLS